MMLQFLQLKGFAPRDVHDVIITSVVPKVMHSFSQPGLHHALDVLAVDPEHALEDEVGVDHVDQRRVE
mgnify:CR=1 FL=1